MNEYHAGGTKGLRAGTGAKSRRDSIRPNPYQKPLFVPFRLRTIALLGFLVLPATLCRADLESLAAPHSGRSMRSTSTFREGKDGKYDPRANPKGDNEERSNSDNFRVKPGDTHVMLDAKGPGVITHIWMTFLGPEPQ